MDPVVLASCESKAVKCSRDDGSRGLKILDVIYLNSPRTLAHFPLLKTRNAFNLKIDDEFMTQLQPHCIVMDPMQRSGDFIVETVDNRLTFYRQAENALVVKMAVLKQLLG